VCSPAPRIIIVSGLPLTAGFAALLTLLRHVIHFVAHFGDEFARQVDNVKRRHKQCVSAQVTTTATPVWHGGS